MKRTLIMTFKINGKDAGDLDYMQYRIEQVINSYVGELGGNNSPFKSIKVYEGDNNLYETDDTYRKLVKEKDKIDKMIFEYKHNIKTN